MIASSPLSSLLAFESLEAHQDQPELSVLPTNLSSNYEPVISRLRPYEKRVLALIPTTLTYPVKRARCYVWNNSSSLLAYSLPYRITQESSSYVFDKEFYQNNNEIMNYDLTLGKVTYSAANN